MLAQGSLVIGAIPEQVPRGVPVAVGRDLKEGIAVDCACHPDVVEGRVLPNVRPVEPARHVGAQGLLLMDQLEDVLRADSYVIEENDCCIQGEVALLGGKWFQREIAQLRKGTDTVARLGIDIAAHKVVHNAESLQLGLQNLENLEASVCRVSLHNGHHTAFRA